MLQRRGHGFAKCQIYAGSRDRRKERGRSTGIVCKVELSPCGVYLGSTKEKQAVKEECK